MLKLSSKANYNKLLKLEPRFVGFSSALIGASFIGLAPVLAKLAVIKDLGGIGPLAVAFWRLTLAIPILSILGLIPGWGRRRPHNLVDQAGGKSSRPIRWYKWLIPGIFFALDLGFWHLSFEYTSVANATLEANFSAILLALYGYYFRGERFDKRFVLGIMVAFVGLAGLLQLAFAGDTLVGDLLGIATAFCYAGYILAVGQLAKHYTPLLIIWSTCIVGSLMLGLTLFCTGAKIWPQQMETWIIVTMLMVTAQLIGQGLITLALAHLSATHVGVTLLWQPVMAAILGWLVLDQSLESLSVLCGGLVLIGIGITKSCQSQTKGSTTTK